MLLLVLFLVLLAGFLLWLSSRQRRKAGLPGGRLIYVDTNRWGPVEKPLYDRELNLTGKPDYLVKQGDLYIPVEIKSSRITHAPYDSHIFQLAAYCLLVTRTLGIRPPYGLIHYPNRTFAIDYTPKMESALIDLLAEIRQQEHHKEVNRSHNSAARCRQCGYRTVCSQALK
jgi:CRISPR-associated exonuclease Cas4